MEGNDWKALILEAVKNIDVSPVTKIAKGVTTDLQVYWIGLFLAIGIFH